MDTDIDQLIKENERRVKQYQEQMRQEFEKTQAETKRITRNATIAMLLAIPASLIGFVIIACIKAYIQLYC